MKLSFKNHNKIVFYVVKSSTIKKFLILDLVAGTGIYVVIKIIYSSILFASVGSFVVTEGIKKISNFQKKSLQFKL